MPNTVGVPEIVIIPPAKVYVTPAGKPLTVAFVKVPPKSYRILGMALFIHTVGLASSPALNVTVALGCTITVCI